VLLAANVIALYRVDAAWTSAHLLPLFDWQRSDAEAKAAWEGFLWAPRLYRPLLQELRGPFLNTAAHYGQLGDHARQYARLLTHAALDSDETVFPRGEFALAFRMLPGEGLVECAHALAQAVEAAGDQSANYWANRVAPFLKSVWPKTRDLLRLPVSEPLARLSIAAGNAFSDAFNSLKGWLKPLPSPEYVVHRLQISGLTRTQPEASLAFLDHVVTEAAQWPPSSLKACLDQIGQSDPNLLDDPRFERLLAYFRIRWPTQ
jgi:hypothetical protein